MNKSKSNQLGFSSGTSMDGMGGVVVCPLASHLYGPGFKPRLGQDHMWVEFVWCVVLSCATRVFLRVLRFSSLHKNQHVSECCVL